MPTASDDGVEQMIFDEAGFWNEQHLLETFEPGGKSCQNIGVVSYLARKYMEEQGRKCPIFSRERSFRQPGSFWIQKESE